ncbi:sugar transferase [Sulfuricurvum sp.]|uniref:sugar transferase n=1 Tax=Sulfuricurvum sp. TaxID=2025608 RepID=UPI003567B96F
MDIVKRLFDIIFSMVILFAASPIFVITSLAIWIESRGTGTILYKSRRRGRLWVEFDMFKFRSMIPDAEKFQSAIAHLNEASGKLFKIRRDPRITPVGKIIRRLSIDELPQIFNVLRGEMSLVGPRPLPVDQFDYKDDRQTARLLVRPGITGLWQIRGRSDVGFERMLKLDLFYIQRRTLAMDMWILCKTVPAVLNGRGAF